MSFDGTDAALAALQTQESSTSLPHLAEADQAGQMLDAAMLAAAGTAWPADAQAVMAAPAEDAGEVLVASLIEMIDAPLEAEALAAARTDADSDSAEFDLALIDPVLPEAEEFFVDNVTHQSTGQTIVVTGTRVRLYFVPSEPVSEPPLQGDTAVIEPIEAPANPDAGFYVYDIIALGLKIRMPEAEWKALSEAQKNALFQVLENYTKSDDLKAALQHYKNEGVEVVLRFGTQSWNARTGLSYDFAQGTVAGVTADPVSDDRTQLRAGSLVVISFNSNHGALNIYDQVAITLIHELLHTMVPNTLQNGRYVDDEEAIEALAVRAWGDILRPVAPTGS